MVFCSNVFICHIINTHKILNNVIEVSFKLCSDSHFNRACGTLSVLLVSGFLLHQGHVKLRLHHRVVTVLRSSLVTRPSAHVGGLNLVWRPG